MAMPTTEMSAQVAVLPRDAVTGFSSSVLRPAMMETSATMMSVSHHALARCGDGFVQDGVEECDDGNRIDSDACRNNCRAARCGDGIVFLDLEDCDDGNLSDNDGCTNRCAVARCGDGFVQEGIEECDDANVSAADACTNVC